MSVITDIIILTTLDEAAEILRYIIRSTDNGHKLKRTAKSRQSVFIFLYYIRLTDTLISFG